MMGSGVESLSVMLRSVFGGHTQGHRGPYVEGRVKETECCTARHLLSTAAVTRFIHLGERLATQRNWI